MAEIMTHGEFESHVLAAVKLQVADAEMAYVNRVSMAPQSRKDSLNRRRTAEIMRLQTLDAVAEYIEQELDGDVAGVAVSMMEAFKKLAHLRGWVDLG